jgi:hypothetical protein
MLAVALLGLVAVAVILRRLLPFPDHAALAGPTLVNPPALVQPYDPLQ